MNYSPNQDQPEYSLDFNLKNCAILVLSTDKYVELWEPFFLQFSKHWDDCPFKIYLGSNTLSFNHNTKVHTILSGPDKDWSTSLKIILSQIQEEFIFVFLEDLVIISDVKTKEIMQHFSFMQANRINHMHFEYSGTTPDFSFNSTYGIYEPKAPYRCNVFGFWSKKALNMLLVEGENPWNFEIMGSYRSQFLKNFYSIKNAPFQTINVVEKGSYIVNSLNYCKMNGIKIIPNNLKVPNLKINLLSKSKKIIFDGICKLNWRTRLKIMDSLRKLLACY